MAIQKREREVAQPETKQRPAKAQKVEKKDVKVAKVEAVKKPEERVKVMAKKDAELKKKEEESEESEDESSEPSSSSEEEVVTKKGNEKKKEKKEVDNHLTLTPFPITLACYSAIAGKHKVMSRIQEQCLAPLMAGKDLRGQSKTGTGKTLAYLIPAVELAIKQHKAREEVLVLVVLPTAELVNQTHDAAQLLLARHQTVTTGKVYGDHGARHPHILFSTPHRLAHLISNDKMDLSKVKMLVLDEVDRLLDMGFKGDVDVIRKGITSRDYQRVLFSATMTEAVEQYGDLREGFVEVSTLKEGQEAAAHKECDQQYVMVEPKDLLGVLLTLFKESVKPNTATLVFLSSNVDIKFYHQWATAHGIVGEIYNGQLGHGKRATLFQTFREKGGLLFASSLIARGVDFPLVQTVIQIGAPANEAEYVHKIGRMNRLGGSEVGRSVLVLTKLHKDVLKFKSRKLMHEIQVKPSKVMPEVVQKMPLADRNKTFRAFFSAIMQNKIIKGQYKTCTDVVKAYADKVYCSDPYFVGNTKKLGLPNDDLGVFTPPAAYAEAEKKMKDEKEQKVNDALEAARPAREKKKKQRKQQQSFAQEKPRVWTESKKQNKKKATL